MAEPFQYAVIRLVPRIEREEFINVGVVVFCRTLGYLDACVKLDADRVRALWPEFDPEEVRPHLEALVRVARGDADAGPIAALTQSERFGWIVAPSSTIIQSSAAHAGLCDEPQALLARLATELLGAG